MSSSKILNAIMYTFIAVGMAVSGSVMGVAVLGLVLIVLR